MPQSYGAKTAILVGALSLAETAMTRQGLTATYVYAKKAPAARSGDTYCVLDMPTEIDSALSNRLWIASDNIVLATFWSANPNTAFAIAEEFIEVATARTAGVPVLAATGFTVFDVERAYRDAQDDITEGETDYFMEAVGLRVRLKKN